MHRHLFTLAVWLVIGAIVVTVIVMNGCPWWLFGTVVIAIVALERWGNHVEKRRRRWLEAGRCHACGYDLRGVPGSTCPECGAGRVPNRMELSSVSETTPPGY